MKRHLRSSVLAAAILLVGAVAIGVPMSSLWIVGFVVLCPLTMIFTMGGMHGDGRGVTSPRTTIPARGRVADRSTST